MRSASAGGEQPSCGIIKFCPRCDDGAITSELPEERLAWLGGLLEPAAGSNEVGRVTVQ